MIIKKMTAHFGALEGKTLELGEGLNVLYAPNESGKSTWCAFLRAMLYGVDTAQRARGGQQPDKKKYLPWSGEPMSGSMDILTPEGPVTIRRWTERDSLPMQAFSATVTGTEDPVPGLTGQSAGQILTGATREVFERSAFIRQAALAFTSDPELEKRFAAIVSGGDEAQSYTETDERLRAWVRHRTDRRRGAIAAADAEAERARQELEAIAQARRAVQDAEAELSEAQARQQQLVRHMEQARAEARKKALADVRAAREDTQARQRELDEAAQAMAETRQALERTPFAGEEPDSAAEKALNARDQAEALARQAEGLAPAWLPLALWAIGGVVCAAAAVLCWLLAWHWAAYVAAAAAFLALGGGMLVWRGSILRRRERLLRRREQVLEPYGVDRPEQIDDLLDKYEALWDRALRAARGRKRAAGALEDAQRRQKQAEELVLSGLDFSQGESEAARATRAVEEGKDRLERLRERRAIAEGRARAAGDEMVLRSAQADALARRQSLSEQADALTMAAEAMAQADLALREKFSPELARTAAGYFAQLTGGRYDEITLARDLSAKTRRAGDAVGREADYLSQGARDQLYLALRLAVCRLVLPPEQGCPIVLDDALAAFDAQRMARALQLLRELGRERQVLVFSCHRRELEYFAGDSGVTRQELEGSGEDDV